MLLATNARPPVHVARSLSGPDSAERSWVVTAAKSEEFPIVVIAGTPVGGFHELTQLDVQGELKRRVFAS